MQPTRYGLWLVLIAFALAGTTTRAEPATNKLNAIANDAEACVRRLREINGLVAKLEDRIPTNQVERLDCVQTRAIKLKGLLDLSENVQQDIRRALIKADPDTLREKAANVQIICARAEKLLAEAQGCAASQTLKNPSSKDTLPNETNATSEAEVPIIVRAPRTLVARRPVERTENTCLRHERFAFLLARAMDLKPDATATTQDYVKQLGKLAVEPLGGWRPGKCATVDDVYVACARAMNLKVKDPENPLSYARALRDEGIGIDSLLPEREPNVEPAVVLESEVRSLLTTGYAAPLPTSKRLTPD